MGKCTEEDFAKLYPVEKRLEAQAQDLKDRDVFYCIKDTSGIEYFGKPYFDVGRVSMNIMPCNIGLQPGEIPEDNPNCVLDRES